MMIQGIGTRMLRREVRLLAFNLRTEYSHHPDYAKIVTETIKPLKDEEREYVIRRTYMKGDDHRTKKCGGC